MTFARKLKALVLLAACCASPAALAGGVAVTTLAGDGSQGFQNGPGKTARFIYPSGVVVDDAGQVLTADYGNHRIRMIDPAGFTSTLAGTGAPGNADGDVITAQFNLPKAVGRRAGGDLYVFDYVGSRLRKIAAGPSVSWVAGSSSGYVNGPAATAQFGVVTDIAIDPSGNIILADSTNHAIRKVTPAGVVTTLAGTLNTGGVTVGHKDAQIGTAALFNNPTGVAVDDAGNVYVGDAGNHVIRKIDPLGAVTTVAGQAGQPGFADGTGPNARFNLPNGLSFAGNTVYIADNHNNRIRKFNTQTLEVTTVAGNGEFGFIDGDGPLARFANPTDVAASPGGFPLYVADTHNERIRKIAAKPSPLCCPPFSSTDLKAMFTPKFYAGTNANLLGKYRMAMQQLGGNQGFKFADISKKMQAYVNYANALDNSITSISLAIVIGDGCANGASPPVSAGCGVVGSPATITWTQGNSAPTYAPASFFTFPAGAMSKKNWFLIAAGIQFNNEPDFEPAGACEELFSFWHNEK